MNNVSKHAPRMVRQLDARILREALSKIHRHTPPQIKAYIESTLINYANRLAPYCDHSERVNVPKPVNACVCLDCGHKGPIED